MPSRDIVKPITLISFNTATFTGAYQVLSAGLSQACFLVKFINNSSVDATISYDGTNDNDVIPLMSACIYDFQTNSEPNNRRGLLPLGQKIYIKGSAGTGNVYLVGWYHPQQN